MFRSAYQRGLLTVFFSGGSKPLEIWDVHIENGYISRLLDPQIKTTVLDIRGNNVSTSYILCPSNNRILGISMPFMVMVVKNLKKYFTFEITILDDSGSRRRFRVSNFQSTTQVMPLSTVMPLGLADGWNQIQFNLSEFTRRAYNTSYVEVQRIKVNANIRLRRIYFAEKLLDEAALPPEYRILIPLPRKSKKMAGPGKTESTVLKAPSKPLLTSESQRRLKTASMTSIVEIPQTGPFPEVGLSGEEEKSPPPPSEAAATADQERTSTADQERTSTADQERTGSSGEGENPPPSEAAAATADQERTSTADEPTAPGEITSAADESPAPGEITPATDEPPARDETTPVADAATTTADETASVVAT